MVNLYGMEERRNLVRIPQEWEAQLRKNGSSYIPIKVRDFTPEGIGFESLSKIDAKDLEVFLRLGEEVLRFKASLRWLKPTDSGYIGGLKITHISQRDKMFLLLSYLGKLLFYLPSSFTLKPS